jgi:ribosomal protein L32
MDVMRRQGYRKSLPDTILCENCNNETILKSILKGNRNGQCDCPDAAEDDPNPNVVDLDEDFIISNYECPKCGHKQTDEVITPVKPKKVYTPEAWQTKLKQKENAT